MKRRLAILYQATPPPIIDGIRKTMKPGGYSDSGADIAFALRSYWKGGDVVTPTDTPEVTKDLDWVFPDTEEGILGAIDKGTAFPIRPLTSLQEQTHFGLTRSCLWIIPSLASCVNDPQNFEIFAL